MTGGPEIDPQPRGAYGDDFAAATTRTNSFFPLNRFTRFDANTVTEAYISLVTDLKAVTSAQMLRTWINNWISLIAELERGEQMLRHGTVVGKSEQIRTLFRSKRESFVDGVGVLADEHNINLRASFLSGDYKALIEQVRSEFPSFFAWLDRLPTVRSFGEAKIKAAADAGYDASMASVNAHLTANGWKLSDDNSGVRIAGYSAYLNVLSGVAHKLFDVITSVRSELNRLATKCGLTDGALKYLERSRRWPFAAAEMYKFAGSLYDGLANLVKQRNQDRRVALGVAVYWPADRVCNTPGVDWSKISPPGADEGEKNPRRAAILRVADAISPTLKRGCDDIFTSHKNNETIPSGVSLGGAEIALSVAAFGQDVYSNGWFVGRADGPEGERSSTGSLFAYRPTASLDSDINVLLEAVTRVCLNAAQKDPLADLPGWARNGIGKAVQLLVLQHFDRIYPGEMVAGLVKEFVGKFAERLLENSRTSCLIFDNMTTPPSNVEELMIRSRTAVQRHDVGIDYSGLREAEKLDFFRNRQAITDPGLVPDEVLGSILALNLFESWNGSMDKARAGLEALANRPGIDDPVSIASAFGIAEDFAANPERESKRAAQILTRLYNNGFTQAV